MGKDKFPKWLAEEISSVKFKKLETLDFTGYLLDINTKENKIDVQFNEQLPDGRYITTLVLENIKLLKDLKLATDYTFKIIVNKASLSTNAKDYLNENYSVALDNLFSFELKSFASLK